MGEPVIKRGVHVAADGAPAGSPLLYLPPGTPLAELADSELAQLAAEHFVGSDTREPVAVDHPAVGALARAAAAQEG